MSRRNKQPGIGKSKKDRFFGETWTVVTLAPGADIGLKVGDRMRIEAGVNKTKAKLFPEASTALYAAGYTVIDMDRIKDNNITGRWYKYEGLLNSQPTTLWITEGGIGTSEAEITKEDPTIPGSNGGLAGIRR